MATQQSVLFNWDNVDNLSELNRLRLVLDTLPDDDLLDQLKHTRQRGRNDYPIEAMWRLVIASIVFHSVRISTPSPRRF